MRKGFIFLVIIFVFQFAIFEYIANAPFLHAYPDKTFNSITAFDIGYVSYIRQSEAGHWRIVDNRTTSFAPKVFAYPIYVVLGKINQFTHMDAETSYFFLKIIGALCVFAASYIIIRQFIPPSVQGLAVLFVLGLEIGPIFAPFQPALFAQGAVVRHFGLPHHTIGEAVGFLYLLLFYKTFYSGKKSTAFALFAAGIVGGAILLPFMLVLLTVLEISFFLISIMRHKIRNLLFASMPAVASVGLTGLFYQHEFSLGLPWNNFYTVEKVWYASGDMIRNYIMSHIPYIPFFILFVIFVPIAWKKLSPKSQDISIIGLVWILLPFIVIPILPFVHIPLANFRIIDTYIYLFPGLIAAIGSYAFFIVVSGRFFRNLFFVLVIITVGFSLWLTYVYTGDFVYARSLAWSNIYPDNTVWEGVHYFRGVPEGTGVLATEYSGDVIADQALVRVYVGITPGYPDQMYRAGLSKQFYSGQMPDPARWLRANNITYVFYGPDEQNFTTKSPLYPDILTPVYKNSEVTIYTYLLQ